MSALVGSTVYDGDKAIADVACDGGYFVLRPRDTTGWSKGMGKSIDETYIAAMFACSICGGCSTPESFMEPARSKMLDRRACFTCIHWLDMIEHDAGAGKDRAVIVNGRHYTLGKNTPKDGHQWAGFGGDVFNIEFHDGRKVRCNNLWSQGTIPERWRDRLPDNAIFAERSK